ncbi:hypothetical protein [Ochrobactrum sp. Marseille-Q0166]|uniref:hypothetical protein n=1 Tax=Ochrobactrum sp. Marseille-Q0166 TaxID=2761105 RepID=UPI0016555C35|nr:hypothetical protein [Ochrobactrum sp. Marseille-Q0166]MBC8718835.1 hypothetical protein [Ochrobactrum sp. Marseille-Q0166]
MIDTKASPNGDVQIHIDGKTETIQSATVAAFISRVLWQTSEQAAQSGNVVPEGGAVLYPTGAAVEFDRESGEPRLQLTFGKALFSIAMPAGEMANIAETVTRMLAKKPA